jgi:hypothetical protein
MLEKLRSLWPSPLTDSNSDLWVESAPPVPIREEDDDPTEPCCPPTVRSTLSPDAVYELAETAIADHDPDAAKAWMQRYNQMTKR